MALKSTSSYNEHPNKFNRKKKNDQGIIITHMIDLIDVSKNVDADLLEDYSDINHWNKHFFYFRNQLGYIHYAYHYFFETYINEIFVYPGCNMTNRSEYLAELEKNGILNPMYVDHTLIVIDGDMSKDVCEEKMYQKLAYFVTGILNYNQIDYKHLLFLEDILNKDKIKTSQFKFTPLKYFDRSRFFREISRFKNY